MNKKLLSVILLSYYSQERILKVYDSLKKTLKKEKIDFEFIIVDDGSTDSSYKIARELEKKEKNVRAFQLSRNFTSSYSIFAGLSVCRGGCATAIPDDEQQPYETIVQMYRLWEKGLKIIIPYREKRADKRFFSALFYKIMNRLSSVTYPPGGADLFFMDREIIDIVNEKIHPINTYIVPEILRLGFDPYFLPYKRPGSKEQKSRWTFRKRFKLGLDIFLASSSFPIRLISFVGVTFSLVSFLLILFYIYIRLFGNREFWGEFVPGWTSIILFIIFFSGLILMALGIIAEYTWRIYEEVKNRPGYIIKKEE